MVRRHRDCEIAVSFRFRAFLFLLLAALFPAIERSHAGSIVLTRDTQIEIVTQGDFGNVDDSLRDMLAKYLQRALRKDTLEGSGGTVRFVLETKAAEWNQLPRETLKEITDIDRFEIEITARPSPTVRIAGATAMATGFGITQFLEQHVGVTWVFPGALGVAWPDSTSIRLREEKESFAPDYASRMYTGMLYSDPDVKKIYEGVFQKQRLYFAGYDYFKSLKLHSLSYASHNLFNIFSVKEFSGKLPEIYPLKDGKRFVPPARDDPNDRTGRWSAWHPCYTNPKTLEIAIQKAKETFDNGAHTFSLGINDGQRYQCECDDCKKAGWPNAYFNFVTQVANAVKSYYPPRIIGILSYGDVKLPPKDLRLPENVMVLVTGVGSGRVEEWATHASHLGVYEYIYGDGFWIPNLPLDAMKQNARLYRDLNARFYTGEAYPNWAFDAPKLYIRSRLMWDRNLNVDAALDRYCAAAFGRGGPHMARYYRHWAELRRGDVKPGELTPMNAWAMWRNSTEQFSRVTDRDYRLGDAWIAKAKHAARQKDEVARVEMVEAFHDFSKLLFETYAVTRNVFDASARKDWQASATRLLQLKTRRAEAFAKLEKHPEWFAGTSMTAERAWGPDKVGGLANEVDNALNTCLFQLNGRFAGSGIPERLRQAFSRTPSIAQPPLHVVPTHPWYPPDRYDRMTSTNEASRVRFQALPGETDGKKQFFVAHLYEKAASETVFYKCNFSLEGQDGEVTIFLQVGSNNSGGTAASLKEVFGRRQETRNIELTVRPRYFDAKTRQQLDEYPKEPFGAMMSAYVVWIPKGHASAMKGEYEASRFDYAPREALNPTNPTP